MEITHGIALFFALAITIIAVIFKSMIWWLMVFGYCLTLSIMAVLNQWEAMFFPVLLIIAIVSVFGIVFTALKGDLI